MKFLYLSISFIFFIFLSTPTIISLLDKKVNTSCFYNMCEEEESNISFHEIKSIPSKNFIFIKYENVEDNLFSFFNNVDLKFFNLAHQIFSPPPNNI